MIREDREGGREKAGDRGYGRGRIRGRGEEKG